MLVLDLKVTPHMNDSCHQICFKQRFWVHILSDAKPSKIARITVSRKTQGFYFKHVLNRVSSQDRKEPFQRGPCGSVLWRPLGHSRTK